MNSCPASTKVPRSPMLSPRLPDVENQREVAKGKREKKTKRDTV
jgi:hypothetical protein